MSNYQVSFVSDVTTSTPYTGKLAADGSIAIYVTGLTSNPLTPASIQMQQMVYADGEISPIGPTLPFTAGSAVYSIPADKITSSLPRFGENIGAKDTIPPVLTVIPIGGVVHQAVSSNIPPNAIMYPTSTSTFYVRSKIWMFKAVLRAIFPVHSFEHGLFTAFVQPTLNNIASYDINAWTSIPIIDSTITGVQVFNASIGANIILNIGASTATNTLIVCLGDAQINNIVAGAGTTLTVVIVTGNIILDAVPGNLIGKVLLIAGGNIMIGGAGTNLPAGLMVAAVGTTSGPGFSNAHTGSMKVQWNNGSIDNASFIAPLPSTYNAGAVAKITQFDMTSSDGAFLAELLPAAMSYTMVTNDGVFVINLAEMLDGLRLQIANQFNLDLATVWGGHADEWLTRDSD